jgi:site-specific recombinase XerD
MELVPKAEFSIVTRASSSAWIPELIAAAGAQVTETYIDFFTSTIRNRMYDFLVVRQITPSNPAHSVRGPKYVVKKGKTPVWSREDAKTLLDSIPKDSVSGLRDLALIAAMFYSFARVSACVSRYFLAGLTS